LWLPVSSLNVRSKNPVVRGTAGACAQAEAATSNNEAVNQSSSFEAWRIRSMIIPVVNWRYLRPQSQALSLTFPHPDSRASYPDKIFSAPISTSNANDNQ
jgi:hypothetical protein